MEKPKSGRSEKITSGSKSKKTLLQSSLTERTINLLKTLGILYYLKSTGH